MRAAILTYNTELYSIRRLKEEAEKLGLTLDTFSPESFPVIFPAQVSFLDKDYRFILNRVSNTRKDDYSLRIMDYYSHYRWANSLSGHQILRDKLCQSLLLKKCQLAQIPTLSYRGKWTVEWELSLGQICQGYSSEQFILKLNRGGQGIGVNSVNGIASLRSLLETFYHLGDQDFILQPLIADRKEWRITMIGREVVAVLEREIKGEGKANFHQHHDAVQAVDWGQVPDALKNLVADFSERIPLDYCSLDIFEYKSEFLFSDINLVPGFEQLEQLTGINFAQCLLQYLV